MAWHFEGKKKNQSEESQQKESRSSSRPVESPASDLVKLLIEGVKELLQFGHHRRVHLGMDAALAACQALVENNVKSQAVKPPGGVEVQVVLADPGGQAEEALDQLQLRQRVRDEPVPVHDVELLHGEVLQPALQVLGVDAGPHRFVLCVDLAGVGVDGQLLELVVRLVFALLALQHLRVVGNSPGGRLADDDQQLDGGVHLEDAFGDLLRDEVGGALLNGNLVREGEGHFLPVPVDAPGVVLVVVEEVDLLRGLDHHWVQVEHLQQGAGAAFAHPDDDSPRQLLDQVVQADLLFGGIALAQFVKQATLELQGTEGDLLGLRRRQSALNGANGLESGRKGHKDDCGLDYTTFSCVESSLLARNKP